MIAKRPAAPTCCTVEGGLAWVALITEAALDGDDDLVRLLGRVVDHAIRVGQRTSA